MKKIYDMGVYISGKDGPVKVYDSNEGYKRAVKSGEAKEVNHFWKFASRAVIFYPEELRGMEDKGVQDGIIVDLKEVLEPMHRVIEKGNGVFRVNSKLELKKKFDSYEEMYERIEKGKNCDGNFFWVEEREGRKYVVFLSCSRKEMTIFRFSPEDIETIDALLDYS
jgi:hypothetical protein